VTVVGVDPGSRSWSIVVLEQDSTFHEHRFSSKQIKNQPHQISELIATYNNVQAVTVPSGYGLPLKPLSSLTERDIILLTLKHRDEHRILGLTEALTSLKTSKIPGFVLPGVIHLSTVPEYRKTNRIDMGTPDKVCSVAAALKALTEAENLPYDENSFVLVEAGSAFTAIIGVQNGKIVDGIGGTEGCMGFRARGGMDGEHCYLLSNLQKESLYRGGFLDVIGKSIEPFQVDQEFLEVQRHQTAWLTLIEGTAKDLISIALSCTPDFVVLSGSLAKNPLFAQSLQKLTNNVLKLKFYTMDQFYSEKEAAIGAAFLADGIIGGENSALVDILELRQASGTCLDYLGVNEELRIDF